MRTAFALMLILSVSLVGSAPVAWAHAVLLQSSPADQSVLKSPPKQVVLRFNGRIEKKISQIELFDSNGRRVAIPTPVDNNASAAPDSFEASLPPLKPGKYRLQYRVLAIDGHATPGVIHFSIESPGPP